MAAFGDGPRSAGGSRAGPSCRRHRPRARGGRPARRRWGMRAGLVSVRRGRWGSPWIAARWAAGRWWWSRWSARPPPRRGARRPEPVRCRGWRSGHRGRSRCTTGPAGWSRRAAGRSSGRPAGEPTTASSDATTRVAPTTRRAASPTRTTTLPPTTSTPTTPGSARRRQRRRGRGGRRRRGGHRERGGGRRSGALGDPRSGRELRGGRQRDAAGGPRRQQDQRDGLGRDQSRRQRPARLRRSDEGRLRRARPGERGPGGGLTRDLLGPARGGRGGEEPRHRRVGGVAVEQRLGGGAVQPGGSSAHLAPPSAVLRPAVTRHARRASWPAA